MNDFKRYIKTYMNILMESWKNDVLSPANMISKPLTLDQIRMLRETAEIIDPIHDDIVILYDPDDPSLFTESRYFHDILDRIYKSPSNAVFHSDHISNFMDVKWKLYDEFVKKVKPFYVVKFNFTNVEEIKSFINTYFLCLDEETMSSEIRFWQDLLKDNFAIYLHLSGTDDFRAMIFNTNKPIAKNTIIHEFTHYLQDVMGIFIIPDNENRPIIDVGKLAYLDLSDNDIKNLREVFVKDDFWPYVNEFIMTLKTIYDDFNKKTKVSSSFFIDYVISTVKSTGFHTSDLFKFIQLHKAADGSMLVFIACIVFNYHKDEVIAALKEELESDET